MTDKLTTPIGDMWLEDGILWHEVTTTSKITEDDARIVVDLVNRLTDGQPMPAIVDIRSIGFATAAARRGFAGSPASSKETATALIVGGTSSRLMAETFLKLAKPSRPIAVFTDPADAKEWAGHHRTES